MSGQRRKPPGVPRAERRRTLAGHFLEAVTPLLERGTSYRELSVQQLITVVGVSRGTFYVYFDDSNHLLAAMAELVVDSLFDAGRSWWAFPGQGTKDDLRDALGPSFDVYQDHRAILVALAEGAAGDERVRAQHRRLVEGVIDALAGHIQQKQAQGLAAPDLHPRRCPMARLDAGARPAPARLASLPNGTDRAARRPH